MFVFRSLDGALSMNACSLIGFLISTWESLNEGVWWSLLSLVVDVSSTLLSQLKENIWPIFVCKTISTRNVLCNLYLYLLCSFPLQEGLLINKFGGDIIYVHFTNFKIKNVNLPTSHKKSLIFNIHESCFFFSCVQLFRLNCCLQEQDGIDFSEVFCVQICGICLKSITVCITKSTKPHRIVTALVIW